MAPHSSLGVVATPTVRVEPNTDERVPGEFLDWTIDGRPLRELREEIGAEPYDRRTFMSSEESFRFSAPASLRALLGQDLRNDEMNVRFPDGRVGILFCSWCGDLGCGAASLTLEMTADTVTWRDIAYQDWEPLDFEWQTPVTLTFDRDEYVLFVGSLLKQWSH